MSAALLFSSLCLVAGGLSLGWHFLAPRRPALGLRLARSEGAALSLGRRRLGGLLSEAAPPALQGMLRRYERDLRRAGRLETPQRLLGEKALVAAGFPLVPLLPYAAAAGRLPSLGFALSLALAGFFAPDLALRAQVKRRREAIFLDLPEAISIMSLSLRAGRSLRGALELAARDCEGPLAEELTRALSLARRERALTERGALVRVAREAGEPGFERFSELLAAKESPYLEFLRSQAQALRAEQGRYLERAAERAYLAMHAPLAPMLAVLVLLVAYGFFHFLAQTT